MPDRTLRHSLAAAAPILCAIHCAATPVAVAIMPTFAIGEAAERALFGASAVLAGWALTTGTRVHRDARPTLLAGLGLVVWALHLLETSASHVAGEGAIAAAALVVAGALIWNARLRHVAEDRACACSTCGHPEAS